MNDEQLRTAFEGLSKNDQVLGQRIDELLQNVTALEERLAVLETGTEPKPE